MALSRLEFNPNLGRSRRRSPERLIIVPSRPYYWNMILLTLVLAVQAVDVRADDPTYRAVIQMDNV